MAKSSLRTLNSRTSEKVKQAVQPNRLFSQETSTVQTRSLFTNSRIASSMTLTNNLWFTSRIQMLVGPTLLTVANGLALHQKMSF